MYVYVYQSINAWMILLKCRSWQWEIASVHYSFQEVEISQTSIIGSIHSFTG